MEISNYIADLSISMSTTQLQQDVNVSMMKKAMDTQQMTADALLGMASSIDPAVGRNLDVSA